MLACLATHYEIVLYVSRLEFYTIPDLQSIVERSARLLQVECASTGALEIARRSRGTPRIANRLLRRVRDYADVKNEGLSMKTALLRLCLCLRSTPRLRT